MEDAEKGNSFADISLRDYVVTEKLLLSHIKVSKLANFAQ